MSLLHEALRKAERSREEAPPRRSELSAVPLEIVAEPAGHATSQALSFEPEPAPQPAPAQPDSMPNVPMEEELEAPDSRRSFHLALGAAGIAALAGAAYIWSQLRPAPQLAQPSPRPAAIVPSAPVKPAAEPTKPAKDPILPGLPPAVPAQATAPEPPPAPPPAHSVAERPAPLAKRPAQPHAGASQAPALPADAPRPSRPARTTASIHPRVQAGFAAYQSGDLEVARAEYEAVLRDDASNRDALLGIAAIETRAGRAAEAEGHYRRLLQADPRDAHAHAGLLALRAQRFDPLQAESRIKALIGGEAEASVLHFSLGNQYARQGRWDEAQVAYARALAADPSNPDFAFNRAVSLDQLRQRSAALDQYRLALELAASRSAHFPLDGARERIQQLSR
jgi:tetratricopeptide (TPR) repeat protein